MPEVSNKRDLLIIPCECELYLGRLPSAAAQALSKGTEVFSLKLQPQPDAILLSKQMNHSDRCIAVDGCKEQCISKILNSLKIECEFHLILTDLGIENENDIEITVEDLQLAMDGITTESTRVSAVTPRMPGCCCS
jgi:uncharacterized metal-binding protein